MTSFEQILKKNYNILKNEKDLSPKNEVVNNCLSCLVNEANISFNCKKRHEFFCSDESILKGCRLICAKAEGEMEKYWADKFNDMDELSYENLREFLYFDNYELIADKESKLMKRCIDDIENSNIIFAGAGALPLTAIIMHVKYGFKVSLLDIDSEAVEKSKLLISKLGLDIPVYNTDFFDADLSSYKVVFLASLVPNKEEAVEHISKQGVKFYILRGADSQYQAFYEDVSLDLKHGYPYSYLPSDSQTLNSTYLFDLT